MLPQLACRAFVGIHEHDRAFTEGFVAAARRGDLPIVQWLCCKYSPGSNVWKSMIVAAVAGQLTVLQWLAAHETYWHQWDAKVMHLVAANGHLEVLQWMYTRPNHAECSSVAASRAVENGHVHVLEWLLERHPVHAYNFSSWIENAVHNGDIERVQRLADLGRKYEFIFRPDVFLSSAWETTSLEMVLWMEELVAGKRAIETSFVRSTFLNVDTRTPSPSDWWMSEKN